MKVDENLKNKKNRISSTGKNSALKKSKGKKPTTLSNEELLEQIMAKKKKKRATTSVKKKVAVQSLSNDELLEQILQKKKETVSKRRIALSDTVTSPIVSSLLDKQEQENKTRDLVQKDISSTEEIHPKKESLSDLSSTNLSELITAIQELEKEEATLTKPITIIGPLEENKKNTSFFPLRSLCIGVICVSFLLVGFIFVNPKISYSKQPEDVPVEDSTDDLQTTLLEQEYQKCLMEPLSNGDTSPEIESYLSELDVYFSKYAVSIQYEDLSLGYAYMYNPQKQYYAASTIKSLDALYVYSKAAMGEIDLNDTVTYTKKFKWGASAYMKNIKYGTNVTLRDLVKYAIMVSDNSAHQMLVSYIGYSNLKQFGHDLGATLTLNGGDNFGFIQTSDAIIYMRNLNTFFENGGELGLELKQYFLDADQNDLKLDAYGIQAAHKYGQYNEIYHDIGIVYDEHPYVIAILTQEGNKKDFEEIVKDMNAHIYKLHTLYNTNRENMCHLQVYGA